MENIEKEQLIERYNALINKNILNYKGYIERLNDVDYEDMVQTVKMYLWIHLDKIDTNVSEFTYMDKLIKGCLWKWKKGRNSKKRRGDYNNVSTSERLSDGKENDANTYENILSLQSYKDNTVDSIYTKEIIDHIKELNIKYAYEIIDMYCFKGYSFQGIADKLGISKQCVHKRYNNIIKRVREFIE